MLGVCLDSNFLNTLISYLVDSLANNQLFLFKHSDDLAI